MPRMLFRAICWTIGVVCLFSFYKFAQFMVVGFNPEFGAGFGAGVAVPMVLMAALWKLDPEAFLGRGQRICRSPRCPGWDIDDAGSEAARE
jgi:hypothetical protein